MRDFVYFDFIDSEANHHDSLGIDVDKQEFTEETYDKATKAIIDFFANSANKIASKSFGYGYGEVTIKGKKHEITSFGISLSMLLKWCEIDIGPLKSPSFEETKRLFADSRAVFRVVQSPLWREERPRSLNSDDEAELWKATHAEFALLGFKIPELSPLQQFHFRRPRTLPKSADKDFIRSQVFNPKEGAWHERNEICSYEMRGKKPKNQKQTKKLSGTLLGPHGLPKSHYVYKRDDRDEKPVTLGFIYDLNACGDKDKKYFFNCGDNDIKTNDRFWIARGEGDELSAYKDKISKNPLYRSNPYTLFTDLNKDAQNNEILVTFNKNALRAILLPEDNYELRINAIHKKLLTEKLLNIKLPIVMLYPGQPADAAREFTLEDQITALKGNGTEFHKLIAREYGGLEKVIADLEASRDLTHVSRLQH